MTTVRTTLTSLFILAAVALPTVVAAQSIPVTTQGSSFTLGKIENAIESIVQLIVTVAEVGMVGAIVYAGFVMATSGDDEKRFAKGKKMLTQAVIGAIVILGVGVILTTIKDFAQGP